MKTTDGHIIDGVTLSPRRFQVYLLFFWPSTSREKASLGIEQKASDGHFWYVGRLLNVETRLESIQRGIRILRPWPAREYGRDRSPSSV